MKHFLHMPTHRRARALGCAFALTAALELVACASSALAADDLMADVRPQISTPDAAQPEASSIAAVTDFSVSLLQQNAGEGNVLVSPLSVAYALGMTANGANGQTLSQMEDTFGLPLDDLNECMQAYLALQPEGDDATLKIANSLWIREGLSVERPFLQANADYYHADAYQAPFDESTKDDVNRWVSDRTDGMIESILDGIPDAAVMYLVNAIAFDADWQTPYEDDQVQDDVFTAQDGSEQTARMMYSTEDLYVEDEQATGFIKPYADGTYNFVALLPNDGVSASEYVAGLDGQAFASLLADVQPATVDAAMPKFEADWGADLSGALSSMGMSDAFDTQTADFTGIVAKGGLCINCVLHKTHIAVDEQGTEASAATIVEVRATSAPMEPDDIKTVHLDRPFVYALVDTRTGLPLFMGITESLEG